MTASEEAVELGESVGGGGADFVESRNGRVAHYVFRGGERIRQGLHGRRSDLGENLNGALTRVVALWRVFVFGKRRNEWIDSVRAAGGQRVDGGITIGRVSLAEDRDKAGNSRRQSGLLTARSATGGLSAGHAGQKDQAG
jgi:hypothetical protein